MNEIINTKKHTKSKIDTTTRIFVSYGELVVPLPIIGFKNRNMSSHSNWAYLV